MIDFVSSFFGFYFWFIISTSCLALIIESFYMFSSKCTFKPETKGKPWAGIILMTIFIFSGTCAIQRYTSAKEQAYPMNFFDSYDDIQNHENFNYKIIVYDEKDSKQVRVHDNENSLTFDFIVKK